MRAGLLLGLACVAAAWMLWLRADPAPEVQAIQPADHLLGIPEESEPGEVLADPGAVADPNQHTRAAPRPSEAASVLAILEREKPFWDVRNPISTERERLDRIRAAARTLGPAGTQELFQRSSLIDTTLAEQLVIAHLLIDLREFRGEAIGQLDEAALKRMRAYFAADGLSEDGVRMIALPLGAWGSDADHQLLLERSTSAENVKSRWVALRALGHAPSQEVAVALTNRKERQALISLQQQIESCAWAFTDLERIEVATLLENSLFATQRLYSIDVLQVLQRWSPDALGRTARRCLDSPEMDDRVIEEAVRLQLRVDPQAGFVRDALVGGNERNRLAAAIAIRSSGPQALGPEAQDALLQLASRGEHPMHRRRAVIALSRSGQAEVDTILADILARDEHVDVRRAALHAMAGAPSEAARAALEQAAQDDPDWDLRRLAGGHLARLAAAEVDEAR